MRNAFAGCARCLKIFEWRIGLYIGIIAGGLHILGFAAYFLSLYLGTTFISATTWGLWTLGALIVLFLYEDLTKDYIKALPLFIDVVAVGVVFIYSIFNGSFTAISNLDLFIIATDIVVLMCWIIYREKNIKLANRLLQLELIVTFIPTIRDVLINPRIEQPLAWGIWTVSYFLMFITSCFRWKNTDSTFTPINYFVMHGIVFVITIVPFVWH